MTYRQNRRRYQSTEVAPPHRFERKVRRHFLTRQFGEEERGTGIQTSNENKTPPMGLPNATATPAAAQALRISRVFAAFRLYLLKNLEMTLPVQTA